MTRAAASPLVRAARNRAEGAGFFAFARAVWESGRLALFTLVMGFVCGLISLAAGEIAASEIAAGEIAASEIAASEIAAGEAARTAAEPPLGGGQIASTEADYAQLTRLAVSYDAILVGVERGTPPDLSVELEAAEFEQEDEEGKSKGVATDAPRASVSEFPRATDERFRRAVFAFIARVGDFRELPRGPPALA